MVTSAYFQKPEPPCTAALEGIEPFHFRLGAVPGLCVCAKQQAALTVSFGSLQKGQENKILEFSNQFIFAGKLVFQKFINCGVFVFKEL